VVVDVVGPGMTVCSDVVVVVEAGVELHPKIEARAAAPRHAMRHFFMEVIIFWLVCTAS
jgi:hypothetical protein